MQLGESRIRRTPPTMPGSGGSVLRGAGTPKGGGGYRPRARGLRLGRLLVLVAVLGGIVFLAVMLFSSVFGSAIGEITPPDGSLVSDRTPLIEAAFRKSVDTGSVVLKINGEEVDDGLEVNREGVACRLNLPDGKHEVELRVKGGSLKRSQARTWSFTVNTVPPDLVLHERTANSIEGSDEVEVQFAGEASPGTVVRAGGEVIGTDSEGRFSGTGRASRLESYEISATDEAGNVARSYIVTQEIPGAKGIHVSVYMASGDAALRNMIDMVERTELNCLQIDIKDEAGQVAFELDHELANQIESTTDYIRMDAVVDRIRYRDIYTIARIVVFKDPILTRGRPDLAVQDTGGGLWGDGTWSDPYSLEVWDYNIAVAEAAARSGFQEIQFDYIRFPTNGNTTTADYPAYDEREKGQVIDDFLAYAREKLAMYNVFISVDLFGLTGSAQGEMGIGQRVSNIAKQVDYISPMVYPSHYNRGEYNISDPESNPYDTVLHSLKDFQKEMEGTSSRLRPWLQDFSLRVPYTAEMVRRQIQACYDAGVDEWLLWDPHCRYTEGALEPPPAQ